MEKKLDEKIIAATASHAEAILNIYEKFIADTAVTFETEVPSIEQFTSRVQSTVEKFPWLVYCVGDKVVGYAYACAHRTRAAYQWCCEVSVYIDPEYQRRGIASKLYQNLLDHLLKLGYFNVYAGITLPNQASERFHLEAGFKLVGTYENVGFKNGEWHSVSWFHLALQPCTNVPKLPLNFNL